MTEDMKKLCSKCDELKCLKDFYSQTKHSKKKGEYIYYFAECKNCTVNRTMKYAKEHYDKHLAGVKKNDSKPKRKQQMREISQKKRDSGSYRSWQQSDAGKKSAKKARESRADKKHEISEQELLRLYTYCNYKCMYCGLPEVEQIERHKKKLFKDHAVNRGSNKIDNCILCCLPCSSSKRDKDWTEWYNPNIKGYEEERFIAIKSWLDGGWDI